MVSIVYVVLLCLAGVLLGVQGDARRNISKAPANFPSSRSAHRPDTITYRDQQGRSVCSISEMLPLPDEGIVVITATCTGDCVTIADMTLELSFVHSYSDELSLELMKAGRTIKLKRVGINPCFTMDYVNATIWDASEDLLETVCPVDGRVISPPSYSPYEELQAFAGVDSCGSWSLRITDHYESDDGVFQSMKLVFMD